LLFIINKQIIQQKARQKDKEIFLPHGLVPSSFGLHHILYYAMLKIDKLKYNILADKKRYFTPAEITFIGELSISSQESRYLCFSKKIKVRTCLDSNKYFNVINKSKELKNSRLCIRKSVNLKRNYRALKCCVEKIQNSYKFPSVHQK